MLPEADSDLAQHPADDEALEATIVVARGKVPTGWKLIDIDGQEFPLDETNVLGRKPQREEDEDAQLIALSDSERVLSRIHARIEVADGKLWVTDLDSTNGTELVEADGTLIDCPAGERTALGRDHTLSLGGRQVSFTAPDTPIKL